MSYRGGAPPPRSRAFEEDDYDDGFGEDIGPRRRGPPGPPPRRDEYIQHGERRGPRGYGPPGQSEASSSSIPTGDPGRSASPDPELTAFLAAQKQKEAEQPAKWKSESEKRAVFSTGVARKSKFQKEKEEQERKRKTEEEEAAAAYKDFVEAMDGPGASSKKPAGFVGAGGSAYAPSRNVAGAPSQPRGMRGGMSASSMGHPARFGAFEEEEHTKAAEGPPPKKRRAMDDFASQLKREQEAREHRFKDRIPEGKSISAVLAMEGERVGSRVVNEDAATTNLCVLNLPANVTEKSMGEFFAQWGDVATVKIMWPRGDEFSGMGAGAGMTNLRKDRLAGLTGFVSYMKRPDAEYAMKETDGIVWGGSAIKTSWGKTMPKPLRPSYTMPVTSRKSRRRSSSPSPKMAVVGRAGSRSPLSVQRKSHRREARSPSPRSEVQRKVAAEVGVEQQRLIETLAERVSQHGRKFEDLVQEKEKNNPQFSFLRDEESLVHHYYRMLLDSNYVPALPPAPFKDEGLAELYSSDSEEDEELELLRKARKPEAIGRAAQRRLEAMLRGITPRRDRIARTMRFAVEHAHAARQITALLVESLLIPSTPVPRKLARLYVVSDILHNSAAPLPNAWKYRQLLEEELPVVFAHLGDVALSFPGRMKIEGFKMQINAVLDTWESWLIFPPATLETYRSLLNVQPEGATKPTSVAAAAEEDQDDIDGEMLDGEARVFEVKDDTDGEELDGEALVEDDLDGEAMEEEEDQEEELDGEALS